MTNIPPIQPPPPPPPPLDYARPGPPPSRNRWWMVGLRIAGGLVAGLVSGACGFWIAGATNIQMLFFVPPGIMLATFLVVAIKYRRFGYVTGFILAPFVAVVAFIVLLVIICGNLGK